MNRSRHRRQSRGRWLVAVAAALAVLVLVVAMAWADRDSGRDGSAAGGTAAAGSSAMPGDDSAAAQLRRPATSMPAPQQESASGSATGADDQDLAVEAGATQARRLDAVPLTGSYRPGATLRVQLADSDGEWSSYPLSIVVDDEGHFSTFVELGRTGPNRLRMVEPATGVTSNEVVVTVG